MAQLVERILGKDEVISSTLITSSSKRKGRFGGFSFFFYFFRLFFCILPESRCSPAWANLQESPDKNRKRPQKRLYKEGAERSFAQFDKRKNLWYNRRVLRNRLSGADFFQV